ncbi:hypothetical protein ACVWWI_000652 [Bradyrhizobium sp. USDA 3686]|uniref:hypothetical protein n=1 Tax=Bradyrhizobium TaxID=374 RepID=UPI001959E6EC|nr:hypothetical protein [Bradyrhizobium canariense]MBM7486230.1 hypothetical protein [Bradyrhizobium canariense]UFW72768.1 hypothetical protein BcanWU425_03065 [Bradyrhizobium canariense]
MLEISSEDIAQLSDEDLRALVGRLAESELRHLGLPASAVTYGGNQNAPDGGIDVRVSLPHTAQLGDFLPCSEVGFQVKKSPILPSDISPEMCPDGGLRPSISGLAQNAGAYIIVSAGTDASDTALEDRRRAMRAAAARDRKAEKLSLHFYDRSRIATWLRNHPALVPWVRQRIGRTIQGWQSHGAWSYSSSKSDDQYLKDSTLRFREVRQKGGSISIDDGIRSLRNTLGRTGGVARLAGLSGVGKTRLAQALFDESVGDASLDPSQAIYCDLGDAPNPPPIHMAENLSVGKQRIILVVDNCPGDLHRRLTTVCQRPGSPLSLLTIEYDIQEDEPDSTDVFKLEPSSDDLIEHLIQRRYPALSQIDIASIARFSGGNARAALVVANTVERNETVASLSDDELLQRLFYQRRGPDERLMKAAQVCALVYSFEGESLSGPSAELPRLAQLIGMQPEELFGYVNSLKARGLIQQRSVWRALLPHTIANNVAKLALRTFPLSMIENAVSTNRLKRSFARRLGFLHDSSEAREIVGRWLSPKGELSSASAYDGLNDQILQYVAPVDPKATLGCLERLIGADSDNISVERWRHSQIARLLRSIAYDPEHFERCINLLLVLAEAEDRRDTRPHQTIIDIIERLFQIRFSGTLSPIGLRIEIAKRLLRSEKDLHRQCGVRAVEALLRTGNFRHGDSFEFGARARGYGLWLKSRADLAHWFRTSLALAQEFACSEEFTASQLRSVIARSLGGLWTWAGVNDELERLIHDLKPYGWHEGWIALNKLLKSIRSAERGEDYNRLIRLERLLRPTDLLSRTRAVVLTEPWDQVDYAETEITEDENSEITSFHRAMDLAEELGQAVGADDAALRTLLPDIISARVGRLTRFGVGLAKSGGNLTSRWNILIDAFHSNPSEQRNYGALCGFLMGVHESNADLADRLLDDLVDDANIAPALPALQTVIPLTVKGLDRLKRLLDLDVAPIENYRSLATGRYIDDMAANDLALLINVIQQKTCGFAVACEILSMRLHGNQSDQHQPALAEAGRSLLADVTFSRDDGMMDYRLEQIVKYSLRDHEGAEAAFAVCKRLRIALENGDIYRFNAERFLSAIFATQPDAALDAFFGDYSAVEEFGQHFNRSLASSDRNPLDSAPDDAVIRWCERDPTIRYPLMSSVISYSCNSGELPLQQWTPLALRLLRHAPDKSAALLHFIERFCPTSWEGSRAAYIENRLPLLTDPNLHLERSDLELARRKVTELQREVEDCRASEAQHERSRGESFE